MYWIRPIAARPEHASQRPHLHLCRTVLVQYQFSSLHGMPVQRSIDSSTYETALVWSGRQGRGCFRERQGWVAWKPARGVRTSAFDLCMRVQSLLETKVIVSAATFVTVCYRHDVQCAAFLFGAVCNALLSKVLKRLINASRPRGAQLSDPGMPYAARVTLGAA